MRNLYAEFHEKILKTDKVIKVEYSEKDVLICYVPFFRFHRFFATF